MTDLDQRFLAFSKDVLALSKELKLDTVSRPLVSQLVRAATSIGANYTEAQHGISRKDFRAKIYICKKEAEETKYWLKLLAAHFPDNIKIIEKLQIENQEIVKILQSIANKLTPPSST